MTYHQKIFSVFIRSLLVCSVIIALWLAISNMLNLDDEYFLVPLSILIALSLLVIAPNNSAKKICLFFVQRPRLITICITFVVILSLAARFTFLAFEYQPIYDPGAFFIAAQNIANENTLGNEAGYTALFPFLYAYNAILGNAMKLCGTGLFTVILLNTFFDFVAIVLLYILVEKISSNRKTAKIAALLWLISPFNIIFSAISLPIIVVNACIIASILLVNFVVTNLNNPKKFIPLSIITGMIFSIANAFRPIIIVFVAALTVYYLFIYLSKSKMIHALVISLVLVLTSFFTLNFGYTHLVSAATGYPPTTNAGGWSIFVGANYNTWGRWSFEDGYLYEVLAEEPTITDAQNRLQKEGIERWRELSPVQTIDLIIKKSTVLGGDQQHSVYNLESYPSFWQNNKVKLFIHLICAIYSLALILLTILYFAEEFKKKKVKLQFTYFIALLFVLLFLASLCVEVANRYFTPFFVFLAIFSAISIEGYGLTRWIGCDCKPETAAKDKHHSSGSLDTVKKSNKDV